MDVIDMVGQMSRIHDDLSVRATSFSRDTVDLARYHKQVGPGRLNFQPTGHVLTIDQAGPISELPGSFAQWELDRVPGQWVRSLAVYIKDADGTLTRECQQGGTEHGLRVPRAAID